VLQQTSSANPKIAACKVITTEEVGAIQSATITDTKSSETSDGSHLISQCYYTAEVPNLSVSVSLREPDPAQPNAQSVRQYWEDTFGKFGKAEREEAADRKTGVKPKEEEEERKPPRKIDGVGDDAFWIGNRVGGALYVLKDNAILRISVGGPDNQETKINKSKALALKALPRL
jgi:hypothetical protein